MERRTATGVVLASVNDPLSHITIDPLPRGWSRLEIHRQEIDGTTKIAWVDLDARSLLRACGLTLQGVYRMEDEEAT